MRDRGCSYYPSTDKCASTVHPFALYVSPPPLSFASLSERRGEAEVRGGREKLGSSAPDVRGLYEGDVNQIQHRQVPQRAVITGPSSHLSSSACFLKAPWNAPPPAPGRKGPTPHPKQHTPPPQYSNLTPPPPPPPPKIRAERITSPYAPLSASFSHSPPSFPPYTTINLSFQFFSLVPATVLSPSHYSLRRIHSVSTRSDHPSPFLSIFPPHISVGALLFAREGACCYWFLSGDVGGTSVDAISDSVALFMLQPSTSS